MVDTVRQELRFELHVEMIAELLMLEREGAMFRSAAQLHRHSCFGYLRCSCCFSFG